MTNQAAIEEIARLAQEATGVQLGARHRPMIQSRLQRRIAELGLNDMSEYLAHLKAHFTEEKKVLISLITTHHTYFFREIAHFEFLRDQGLAEVVAAMRAQGRSTLRIWSAACSRGQESYSLAMWILPWLSANAPGITLKIFGSDIDADSVRVASNGVYPKADLDEAPLSLLANHWARGTGEIAAFVKAKASLRGSVEFKVESLFDLPPPGEKFDVIFCRNVFIYFNPEQIKAIAADMQKRLQPHGIFFVGISETLSGLGLDLDPAAPSAYKLRSAKAPVASAAAATRPAPLAAPAPAPAPAPAARPVRVLCVDDSPTILSILKKLLTTSHGFEIVGTALNGIEAAAKVKSGGIDLVTLDIHMPEMDGIQYLRQHFAAGHPPVVMLSSVSRENSELALTALELGASDYVEKPSLADLAERADEIRFKLKCALNAPKNVAGFDKQFERKLTVSNPAACARVVICSLADWKRAAGTVKGTAAADPGTILWLEGGESVVGSLHEKLAAALGKPVGLGLSGFGPGHTVLLGEKHQWDELVTTLKDKQVSLLHFGRPSPGAQKKIASLPQAQLLLEDVEGASVQAFAGRSGVWRLPATSFLYQSYEFFASGKKAA